MSTSDLKLNLMERLLLVHDAGLLERVKQFLDQELGEDEMTAGEFAELEADHERAIRGEGEFYTIDEAMRSAHEALKK
ncbi:MAG: hypothetical protein ABI432_07545 [Flavobacteriales bacterium]